MKVLVTGGAGFVGSHIADHLLNQDHEVVVVDCLVTGKRDNVNPRAKFISERLERCAEIIGGCEVVIHAAAYADLRHNWNTVEERERLYHDNVTVTRHVLESMAPSAKLLFLSTASVYGHAKNASPVSEDEALPRTCESPYAASKLACEAMIASYAFARKFRWKVGRLVNVVGARTLHGVIGDFVRMYHNDLGIHAADNGKQRKSWVNVHDVADAFIRMMDDAVPDGIYSITSNERISWWDIVDVMGVSRNKVTFEDRPGGAIGDPIDLHVYGGRLAHYYTCRRPVMDGVREALDHLGWTGP